MNLVFVHPLLSCFQFVESCKMALAQVDFTSGSVSGQSFVDAFMLLTAKLIEVRDLQVLSFQS